MQFINAFFVPLPPDEAFRTLTDLERIAPCMPGASLHERAGEQYQGEVRVKVGPMTLTYQGTAEMEEIDEDDRSATITARGREKRGSGTAAATVHARLVETEVGTNVTVTTDLDVTGKPAQFGQGVMSDIGSRLIETFAENLARSLAVDAPGSASVPENVLDLGSIGGRALARRALPVLLSVGFVVYWWWRRQRPHDARARRHQAK